MIKDVIIVLLSIIVIGFVLSVTDIGRERVYDCGMAEWHPDIPVEVKQECRRLRYEEYLRQKQEEKTRV